MHFWVAAFRNNTLAASGTVYLAFFPVLKIGSSLSLLWKWSPTDALVGSRSICIYSNKLREKIKNSFRGCYLKISHIFIRRTKG